MLPFAQMSPLAAGLTSPFVVNTMIFIIAQFVKDNSIVDIGWGMLFIVPNLLVLMKQSESLSPKQLLLMGLILVWGVRLALHIGLRHTGVEDFRYQDMRRRWSQ
jgi:steroid 5-alpha reductase family enzyme